MLLNEDQVMVRDMARRFAAERLAPNAASWDETHHFPRDVIEEMGALGLMGMLVPEEWDGHELRQLFQDYVKEEINWSKMDRNRKKEYDNTRRVNNI